MDNLIAINNWHNFIFGSDIINAWLSIISADDLHKDEILDFQANWVIELGKVREGEEWWWTKLWKFDRKKAVLKVK